MITNLLFAISQQPAILPLAASTVRARFSSSASDYQDDSIDLHACLHYFIGLPGQEAGQSQLFVINKQTCQPALCKNLPTQRLG
ncbi:hypothetical protein [Chromobacterium sphagni]|uniref:hypothetical protein n=1 Tax=Chromobacterium sphagni TaxID=1903179 RepID=UPI001113309A|nr:hypothetical protein [Chromobacterium sphagni]